MLALYAALFDRRPDGVVDLVPAGSTILVVIDPAATTLAQTRDAVLATEPRPDLAHRTGDPVEIRVHYDGEDLPSSPRRSAASPPSWSSATPARSGRSRSAASSRASATSSAPHRTWDVPRRSSPRTQVPAGSVALAGEYAGVYPRSSPGGWQLIGRTDDGRLRPRPRSAGAAAAGHVGAVRRRRGRAMSKRSDRPAHALAEALEVVETGPLATVQDAGRLGLGALGIGRSGRATGRRTPSRTGCSATTRTPPRSR